MKKMMAVLAGVMVMSLFSANALADEKKENYVFFRYDGGEGVSGTVNVYENYHFPGWTLGVEIDTGKNDFQAFYVYAFREIIAGLKLGAQYYKESGEVDDFVPYISYTKSIGDITASAMLREFLGDKQFTETWGGLTYSPWGQQGLYFGMQVGYYFYQHGDKYWYVRIPAVGYRFSNGIAPMIWYQHQENDVDLKADTYMLAVEISF
jgi:hypothetical protein